MNVEPGEATVAILTVVGAAAAWINNQRKTSANNARQIKNDENATEWQTSLLESNREKDKQLEAVRQELNNERQLKQDAWMLVSEARHDIFEAQSDAKLWKLKFEQCVEAKANEPVKINEHIAVLSAALQSANEEIIRLRERNEGKS